MKIIRMTTSLRHLQSLAITGVAALLLFSFGCATSTSPTQNGGGAPGGTLYFA
jgi:hypothetical protein